jgi:hypothetical protein
MVSEHKVGHIAVNLSLYKRIQLFTSDNMNLGSAKANVRLAKSCLG